MRRKHNAAAGAGEELVRELARGLIRNECLADCIEENMTLEELRSSNALDKSIKEERTRYGDAPVQKL